MDSGEESWTTGHFDATLLTGRLRVGHIASENLCLCTHALVKLLVLDAEESESPGEGFFMSTASQSPPKTHSIGHLQQDQLEHHDMVSGEFLGGTEALLDMDLTNNLVGGSGESAGVNMILVQDLDGVTVVVNDRFYRHLQLAGVVNHMRWAPSPWRTLQIHLGPASADAPGIISYLSSMLSERNVSILNFSTFEADLILVQEFDLEKARELLVECGKDGVCGLKEQIAEKMMVSKATSSSTATTASESKQLRGQKIRSNSTSSETITSACLAVVQTPLVLTSIKRLMLKQSMFSLMKQLTRNIDLHLASPPTSSGVSSNETKAKHMSRDYLWGYFSTNEEVSLLLDERDLKDFPEDSLVVCPQRWKAIRLVAKDIPFDETGIVHIMSSPYEMGVQLLNMSTYSTNVSLVAEDEVDIAIHRLRLELNGEETKVFGHY